MFHPKEPLGQEKAGHPLQINIDAEQPLAADWGGAQGNRIPN